MKEKRLVGESLSKIRNINDNFLAGLFEYASSTTSVYMKTI
jgi:hypothetical protein